MELDAGREWLRVAVDVPELERADAWKAFTDPDRLVTWWPVEAELDLRTGGDLHFGWPQMGWHLRGHVTDVDPERRFAFTWAWDHEPDHPVRTVSIDFLPVEGGTGTRLVVTHGPYGDGPREAEDRQGHLEGWRHFLARLADLQGTQRP